MLYITITLIASGLFLVIYALVSSDSESKDIPAKAPLFIKKKQPEPPVENKIPVEKKESIKPKPETLPEEPREIKKEEQKAREFIEIPEEEPEEKPAEEFDTGTLNLDVLEDDSSLLKEESTTTTRVIEKPGEKPLPPREEAPAIEQKGEKPPLKLDDFTELNDDNIIKEEDEETEIPGEKPGNKFSAVLYEDSSNLMDYQNRNSIIDSTLEEYKKIKRMGKGTLEITGNGIFFNTDKRNYRFDFHRIAKTISGKNYFCLLLKRSGPTRLFIFDNNPAAGADFKNLFNEYTRGIE